MCSGSSVQLGHVPLSRLLAFTMDKWLMQSSTLDSNAMAYSRLMEAKDWDSWCNHLILASRARDKSVDWSNPGKLALAIA